jgi:putative membrane protein
MKSIVLMIVLALTALSSQFVLAAMDSNQTMQSNNTQIQNDGGVLGWLIVLNKTEIAISREVLKRKNLNPMVKRYAKYLVYQHTELLKDTIETSNKLKIMPADTDSSLALQKQGDEGLAQLQSLDGKAIQKPFIDAMVQGHTDALAALKGYIKDEENSQLKALLEVTAKHVASHLEKAKVIQKKLGT